MRTPRWTTCSASSAGSAEGASIQHQPENLRERTMDKTRLDADVTDCCYPFGAPNFARVGISQWSRPPRRVTAAGIAAVADLLGRPARIEDGHGFENVIVAGAVHPAKGWPAWVECRCR